MGGVDDDCSTGGGPAQARARGSVTAAVPAAAGTVGFYALTDPFYKLEVAAQQQDDNGILQTAAEIDQLFLRIDRSLLPQSDEPSVGQKIG